MKKALFSLLFLCIFFAFAQHKDIDMFEAATKINKRSLIIDVRTPAEFKEGHLPHAVNIDWLSADFNKAFDSISKRKKIYVYCRSGKRSAMAASRLDSLCYKRVVNLKGGYKAYEKTQ
ncbi:MAG: rhodanese-like domain-containing protein [Bacteroidetes bacterium]|nr:rhodanese-like domain-containing protein [Bacteroidota bacterium]MDA1143508.1 rhodanese-like domain-containing protein [Bacteroidota bacterium]